MSEVRLRRLSNGRVRMKVLVIAPHPDDEVIGVGGTIAKRAATGDEVYVCVVTRGPKNLFPEDLVEQTR